MITLLNLTIITICFVFIFCSSLNIYGLYSNRLKTISYLRSYLLTSKVSTKCHIIYFITTPFLNFPESAEIQYGVLPSSQFLLYLNSVFPKALSSFDHLNSVVLLVV